MIKMLLKLTRNALGQIVIFFDFITRPKPIQRATETQNEIDLITRNMALYQFRACPFCVKTRRAIHRLNLNIETRDTINNAQHRADLEKFGGVIKVPCLKIEEGGNTQWMYESSDIIAYLENRFGENTIIANT